MEIELNRKIWMQESVSRVRTALVVLMTSWSVAMAGEIRAEQISVETAAKAAGLAVETGNANVNGVTIYYRDIGRRRDSVAWLSRNRRHICVGGSGAGQALSSHRAGFARRRPLAAPLGRIREKDARHRRQGVDGILR
jgi:hypothetical protein